MDYHHHHHRRDEDDEEQRYPPPPQPHLPFSNQPQHGYAPPPPQPLYRNEEQQYNNPIQSHHHQGPSPPPPSFNQFGGGDQENYGYSRPSPPNPQIESYGGYNQSGYGPSEPQRHESGYPSVQHVGHESGFSRPHSQPSEPGYPSVQHVGHESGYPSVQHVGHESGYSRPHPQPEPGYSSVQHVGHEVHHKPHLPTFDYNNQSGGGSGFPHNTPTVRVYSKAETNYSLTIRDGQVILARSDERDPYQHWIKDEKYSVRVKDEEGFPSFSLVNKATGLAMKHSTGPAQPVELVPYNPDVLDQSVLWTESRDLGDSYRTIRMVNNIRLNVDALNGDQNHGGVREGTKIVLWEWKKGENQRWKIVPY